jgi:hypothetical protein
MALKSNKIILNNNYQLLIDNSGDDASENNFIYINKGTALLRFDSDTPDSFEVGMRWSAGAHSLSVPVGSKLYGKLFNHSDTCEVIVNIDS